MISRILAAGLALGLATLTFPAEAATLDEVKQRGILNCGVSTGLEGFSARDASGEWNGFDVDFCRALAGAVLGDPRKVAFTPLTAAERFEALRAGRIDLLSRNSTWTLDREAGMGLLFAGITYHDGQGFMVMRKPEITSALELSGLKVCVQAGTTSQLNLGDYFRVNSMTFEEKAFPTSQAALNALAGGECDVLTSDQSALFAERLKLPKPAEAIILPDVISKEPLGPVVRNGDVAWFTIVRWVNFALVNAEELGVTQANAEATKTSSVPDVRRFSGVEGDFGKKLGLSSAWAVEVVKAGGNYAELYERNLGSRSRLGIPRGLNQLWSMGGILYAPPMR
jgi:general L-amino acid transport system substrate-binding protein